MTSKTERFELRLDIATLERLDEWRTEQEDLPSRAEAVRRLLDLGFSDNKKKNFKLDDPQRLTIWLLTELLKEPKAREADKETIRLIQQAIYGGHYWGLSWEMPAILHSHADKPEEVTFVVDTLDMWSFIEPAYARFNETEKEDFKKATGYSSAPKFAGFDGNNETTLMSIVHFLVKELSRFAYLKDRDINSHMPMSPRYRQMLEKFEPMRKNLVGRSLSVAEVIELIKRS
jgi:uncharacterized protein